MKTIYSWNVNGIRACAKKGALDWLESTSPDMLALQETKAEASQLDRAILEPKGYKSYFFSAEKKGYSGVALYTKHEPNSIETLGIEEFDSEGRVLIASFDEFTLLNCYFPNSQEGGARLAYKLSFCDAILKKCDELVSG
ncbi:MAG: exodeoxyribonuclease III, partial [Campylobacterales bacterium]